MLKDFYDQTDAFGASDGLIFAAALTTYGQNPVPIEDPTIGQLKFNWVRWGSNHLEDLQTIQTRPCSTSDFNDAEGSNQDSKFYKLRPKDSSTLQTFGHLLKCIDDLDSFKIWGNYDSTSA